VTVSGGVATFNNVAVNALGTGYTLVASGGGLSATSSPFSVVYSPLLENFDNGLGLYHRVGAASQKVTITTAAAHVSTAKNGLNDAGDGNWYYRSDAPGQVKPGDSLSVWVQLNGAADGRAYFGFGSTKNGTFSAVLAPNTSQMMIQNNAGYTNYTVLASVKQTFSFNTWYRLQVDWGTSGKVVVSLYGSDGTTFVNSVTASTHDVTPGDFSFRATGSAKFFDTVYVNRGVNNFAAHPSFSTAGEGGTSSTAGSIVNGFVSLAPTLGSSSERGAALDQHATNGSGGQLGRTDPLPFPHSSSVVSDLAAERLWYVTTGVTVAQEGESLL
jgi:hypothetical protein